MVQRTFYYGILHCNKRTVVEATTVLSLYSFYNFVVDAELLFMSERKWIHLNTYDSV